MFYQPVDCRLSKEQCEDFITMLKVYFGIIDWQITFKIQKILNGGSALGLCRANPRIKYAEIVLADYETVKEEIDAGSDYDMLQTLVHEMLHIKMGILNKLFENSESLESEMAEQLVNDMANIITEFMRRGEIGGIDGDECDDPDGAGEEETEVVERTETTNLEECSGKRTKKDKGASCTIKEARKGTRKAEERSRKG